MAKTCKFYKLKQEVSFDCGETWEASGLYEKGRLYEVNSRDCGFMLIYRWALSQGDYDCDSVRKYNMEVLQFTTEQGGEYQNVSPEYKRRAGNVVEWLSEDCGYVESTGGFKFSGTSEISCGHTGRTGEGNPNVLYWSEVSGITAPHSIVGDCTEVIGKGAFSASTIQTIDISSYTTEIKNYAFADCSGLTSMTIPDTVEKVGGALFEGCINLTGATLPSGLDYIPPFTFSHTAVENYVVPNGIKLISNGAFFKKNIEGGQPIEITLNTGLTDIGENVFDGRYFNGTLSLPSSLKYIGGTYFSGATVTLPNGLEHIEGSLDVNSGGTITIPGGVKLLYYGAGNDTEVILSEGTEAIISTQKNSDIPTTANIMLAGGFHPYSGASMSEGEYIVPANVQMLNQSYLCVLYDKVVTIIEATKPPLICKTTSIWNGSVESIYMNPEACDYYADNPIVVPDESLELYKTMWSNVASKIHPRSHLIHDWRPLDISTYWDCVGVDKHYQERLYVSADSGETWEYTSAIRTGALYEANSTDCGFIPLEYTSVVTYNDGKCNSVTRCDTSTAVPSYCGDTTVSTITIGKCARSIPSTAFQGCSNATDLTVLSGITSIGDYAFQSCTNLTSITIADSVRSVGGFSNCNGLTSIGLVGSGASFEIPDSVTTIDTYAFSNCDGLRNVVLPDSVTTIDSNAFRGCDNLTAITIPNSVTYLGSSAFTNCTGLMSVEIPSGVTYMSTSLFEGCYGLTGATIPEGATGISSRAFYWCMHLDSITIPDSVTWIGDSAFYRCSGLKSVTIGSGVTSISHDAFRNCSSLTAMTIYATTPPSLSDGYALSGTNNCTIYVPCESKQAYKSANIWRDYSSRIVGIPPCYVPPSFIARYSDSTEYTVDCETSRTVTSATTDPSGYQQSAMTEAIIGDCVTSIGQWSFLGCSNMTACTIGSGVTSIGQYAFYNCSSLVGVTINRTSPPSLGNYAFNGTGNCPLYVPSGSVSTYKSASGWSNYSSRIQAIPT